MESILKFRCHFLMAILFIISYETCSAQDFLNYNEALLRTEKSSNTMKISTILNSNSIKFSDESSTNRAAQTATTLDINYSNLSSLNNLNTTQFQSVRNCIVRISTPISNINLNALNQFTNLEIVHLIIETNAISGNIQDLIIMNNPQVLISYQISIPE